MSSVRVKAAGWLLLCMVLGAAGNAQSKGTIAEGYYHSPLGNFSYPIRDWKLQENDNKNGGVIANGADSGELEVVNYGRIAPDVAEALADPARKEAIYKDYFLRVMVAGMARSNPAVKVVHEDYVGQGVGRDYFALVRVPGGSSLRNVSGQKLDSVRAFLVFDRGGFFYVLSYELVTQVGFIADRFAKISLDPLSPSEPHRTRAMKKLQNMRAAMRFE